MCGKIYTFGVRSEVWRVERKSFYLFFKFRRYRIDFRGRSGRFVRRMSFFVCGVFVLRRLSVSVYLFRYFLRGVFF